MTEKRKEIFDRITEIRDRMEDAKCEMALLRQACEQLKQERDVAIQRAEKAEAERDQLRKALKLYGNPDNWQFTHNKENNLLWVTSLGPDYAIEILNEMTQESSEEKEVANV